MSGFVLKLIAVITMLIDHIGAVLFPDLQIFRIIGRVAFPIFCFLLVEGLLHTKNTGKYLLRLSLFALASEVPFDLAFKGSAVDFSGQNVFFTLALGLLAIYATEKLAEKSKWLLPVGIALTAAVACAAELLHTDYGWYGIAMIAAIYLFRKSRAALSGAMIALILIYSFVIKQGSLLVYEIAALPVILMYNGERGQNSAAVKYGFYAFYPAHLLCLYFLHMFFIPVDFTGIF